MTSDVKKYLDRLLLARGSAMELIFGARDKDEFQQIDAALTSLTLYHANEPFSDQALALMRHYGKSHGLTTKNVRLFFSVR